MDWNTLNIDYLKSTASILSLILKETVLCLPLDLILVGSVYETGGTVKGLGSGSAMSLMTCGDACGFRCCGGYELVVTAVSLCDASVISVFGDYPLEVTGLAAFTDLTSNIGAWFAKSTSCVTPLIESVLNHARADLLNLSFF